MKEHTEIDVTAFSKICQHPEIAAKDILEQTSLPPYNLLEKRGKKKGVTYHLSKNIAEELIGRVAYTRIKGVERYRYKELILNFVHDHASISNAECRELLGLGDSNYASVKASEILNKLCKQDILSRVNKGRATRYIIRKNLRDKKWETYH